MGWKDESPVVVDWKAEAPVVAGAPAPSGMEPGPDGWQPAGVKRGGLGDLKQLERDQNKQQTAMWGALASGAHGAANAMEGPVNGALSALGKDFKASASGEPMTWDELKKAYYGEKGRIEGEQKQNLKDFPNAPLVGAVMAGGVGSAPSALGRVALSAGQGALYGAGSSPHDLAGEHADPEGLAKDSALGLGAGAVGGVLGEAAQIPGRALAKRAGVISDATHAATLAAETEARAAAAASAAGKEGGLTASAMKAWDRLEDAMFNPAATEETKAWARTFISSDEGKALYNQVLKNYSSEAPKMMGRLGAAKEARAVAEAANKPELIQQAAHAAAEAKLGDTGGVTSRVAELARRNGPAAIGSILGGPAGAAAGALYSGVMGKQGRILTNMLSSPSAFIPLTKAAGVGIGAGNAMSHAAPPLAEWSRFLKDEDQGDE